MRTARMPKKAERFPLARLLRERGLSKYAFARLVGLQYGNVLTLCAGTSSPSWATLMRIKAALGCSLADFEPRKN